jgi:CRP/FNR family transcriptional regulator
MVAVDEVKKLFPGISHPKLLEEMATQGKLMSFSAGEIIIDQGMAIPFIPMLISGTIKVSRQDEEGHELLLYYLNPGETCATSLTCCISGLKSEVQALAEEEVTVMAFPSHLPDEWMMRYPEWKNLIMMTFRRRFDDLIRTINDIAFKKLDDRLTDYLKERSAKKGGQVEIVVSHQEIANDLNSSREVISRLLKHMEREGKLSLGRNRVTLVRL